MTVNLYDDHGVRFRYPTDWELEVTDDGPVATVAFQSPSGLAFAMVTLDATRPEPDAIADEALEAMREEYPTIEATPARDTIGGHPAVGHDAEFFTLDMTNSCSIRAFRSPRRTALVFGQWSDLEGEGPEALLRAVWSSLEETDA